MAIVGTAVDIGTRREARVRLADASTTVKFSIALNGVNSKV